MSEKIKLSIQVIFKDFERLVRYDERLDVYFENQLAVDEDVEKFFNDLEEMMSKYLPTYEEHMSREFFLDDTPVYDKALELYKDLYENFRFIFSQLASED